LIDRIEPGAFITLFDDSGRAREAEVVNDIENNVEEEEKKARPKRNAPIPARYVQRIYAVTKYDDIDVCYWDDFQEVEGFGADEVRPEDVGSGDEETGEVDQVELAGCAFRAARLQLSLAGEGGMPIRKTRGALKGMWLDAIPRVYGINREPGGAGEPMSGKVSKVDRAQWERLRRRGRRGENGQSERDREYAYGWCCCSAQD